MIWPWSTIRQLEGRLSQVESYIVGVQLSREVAHNTALKAIRDLSAANKGIRRLKDKLKKATVKESS